MAGGAGELEVSRNPELIAGDELGECAEGQDRIGDQAGQHRLVDGVVSRLMGDGSGRWCPARSQGLSPRRGTRPG
ncbi:hypothetical protein NKH18_01790 [Streptomyces sp. M10(2022)]